MIDENLDISKHDERDPNPWLALFLDESIPINQTTKLALMRDNASKSARYLLPIIHLWSKVTMFFIHIFKFFFPNLINSSKVLHRILAWGLKNFVSPDANLLVFRHFHIGTEILQFIAANTPEAEIVGNPLKPKDFEDVKDDLFLQHDLNLYNFVIQLNNQLKQKGTKIQPPEKINLDMITEDQFDHIEFPRKWTNFLDLRSAIELFTPYYQLFLTSNDFIRASNSLQLDETIAIYTSQIINTPGHLGLVNNKHPMVPATTYSVAYRLVLHGLAAETLHEVLVKMKLNKNRDGIVTPMA
ncbi:hypothetical protein SAMN05421766_103459 [Zobellia uliginosa]|uniref:Uncharacterized protein n=1 Tax=Zobellia uliginosa TaxID=143224 RepID=A0ABY1KRT0_9FLAO|nr:MULTISPECIES: hypothetical protein [Zobellia]MBU2973442.1 hypothetical protein [Zobellia sp. B3R18]MDO6516811.1 hypothetical protein [Zobellia uliginosa]SIS69867.1 hypothetical protein SAMN05421766_103459 [Zobellia uliginosa]